MCAIEDETAVAVVTPYHSVSRNPVRFKALVCTMPQISGKPSPMDVNVFAKYRSKAHIQVTGNFTNVVLSVLKY